MNIQIRGSGTAIEFRRLTEEQYRYWVNEGEAAIKRHLDGEHGDCSEACAVTSTAEADHASLVGPCPYSAMMYVTGDAGGDIEIDLAARKISTVGGSLRDVQSLAGHSSLQTTQRYIEGDSEARKRVVDLV